MDRPPSPLAAPAPGYGPAPDVELPMLDKGDCPARNRKWFEGGGERFDYPEDGNNGTDDGGIQKRF